MKIGDRLEVEWIDAQHGTTITHIDDFEDMEPVKTKSVGILVVDKKEFIILGFMIFDNLRVKHYQLIPRAIIQKIKILGVKRK